MSNPTADREPLTRVGQAAYVIGKLQSLGVRFNPASRLMLMLRTLERGHIGYDDRRFPVALESIRDMYQLRLIVDQMDAYREHPTFRASVEKMLLDATLPQAGNSQTPGRDTQFELYLAAVCLRAGLTPVDYAEPDLTCTIDGRKFGIAAKRLKSLDRLQDRIKEGADQLRRAKLPGIVALDLTIARNPDNLPITSGLQSQLCWMMKEAANRQFFVERGQDVSRWVAGTGTCALLVFEFTFRVSPDSTSWIHDGMMFWFPTTGGDPRAEQDYHHFQECFKQGMPNVVEH